ncbi:hypothetical protein, partial [Flavobacterium rakeshii]
RQDDTRTCWVLLVILNGAQRSEESLSITDPSYRQDDTRTCWVLLVILNEAQCNEESNSIQDSSFLRMTVVFYSAVINQSVIF